MLQAMATLEIAARWLPRCHVIAAVTPHLAAAPQAGFWGYDSWGETVAAVLGQSPRCPLLVTSYNLAEAEDDEEALQRIASAARYATAPPRRLGEGGGPGEGWGEP